MSRPDEVWVHLLGARAGGGLTWLRAVVPELVRQLEGRVERLVLLLPAPAPWLAPRPWVEARVHDRVAGRALRRLVWDQALLPLALRGRRAALLCAGSYAPLLVPAAAVLLRNAIHFDEQFLARERPARARRLRLQGRLMLAGARRARRVLYPSRAMRELVERLAPDLAPKGLVAPYGVDPALLGPRPARPARRPGEPLTFIAVLSWTLQKNLSTALRALELARREGLAVRLQVTSRLDRPPAACAGDLPLVRDLVASGHLVPLGPLEGAPLRAACAAADGALVLSTCESFGHPLVEALALGLPLVASDRPFAREVAGPHALLVDPERPDALVDVWRRWPACLAGVAPIGQDELARRFSWPGHVATLVDALLG